MDPKDESKLRIRALEKAGNFVVNMKKAKTDPTVQIAGEALKIYKELEEWGWLDQFPVEDESNSWMYQTMIAMTQYRHMKWAAEHPVPVKRTKWERVMGVAGRR